MDESMAMIDVENAINMLLPEISSSIPKHTFAKIYKDKEKCNYVEALECITEYIEHLQPIALALLLESWILLCRYRRLLTAGAELCHERFYAGKEETWIGKLIHEQLATESYWLESSEAGKKKVTSYLERQKKLVKVNNRTALKAKSE
jgi:hypothetical protein